MGEGKDDMVIHSSVRTDGTVVEVVKRSDGTFFVRTTDKLGHVKTKEVSLQQVYAMGLSREAESAA